MYFTAYYYNQSPNYFRSAIVIFRPIQAARCKKIFSLQGFPHVSDNTATKGTVCLGGQGHNPGDWEECRRKIGPPNCPAELLGFLRRIGGVVGSPRHSLLPAISDFAPQNLKRTQTDAPQN